MKIPDTLITNVIPSYDHNLIEHHWSAEWSRTKQDTLNMSDSKKPFFNLMMFPYPSAEGLHVGNMYAFTGSDIYGRFKRLQGFDVFEPIGLDGFGIHSENYAFKIGKHPIEQSQNSEKNFYKQLKTIGAMFDWTRTIETYDPEYYRWTQWLFTQMFKHGMAYRSKASVNWCPGCKTVLADEQVINNLCERCGSIVVDKILEQWFFRITAFTERLLHNIKHLDWSDKVKIAQETWIGKNEGIEISYKVVDSSEEIVVWTAHPNTNFGATFIVLAPEHPLCLKITTKEHVDEVMKYIETTASKSKEMRIAEGKIKTGVFTGSYAINSLTGFKLPIYITDFVLMNVGTGAVVGVPAHDERDYAFAKVFSLPSIKVIDFDTELHCVVAISSVRDGFLSELKKLSLSCEQKDSHIVVVATKESVRDFITILKKSLIDSRSVAQVDGIYKGIVTKDGVIESTDDIQKYISKYNLKHETIWKLHNSQYPFCYVGEGKAVNSEFLNGLSNTDATEKVMMHLEQKHIGKRRSTYHLRDWLISRQRYWGPPIPMIYCSGCASKGKSWFTTKEGKKVDAGQDWDSSGWYPVADASLPVLLPNIQDYKPGNDGVAPLAKHKEFYETLCPECGNPAIRETDVSDTFLDSSWYFLRYPSIGSSTVDALPFDPEITKTWLPVPMYTGGAEHSVLHLMYSRFVTMALHDWGYINFEEPFARFFAHGLVIKDGAKMSKSKGNVVNPDEYIRLYGSDALRMYLMFMGPFNQGGDFRDAAMQGMYKWIKRVWSIAHKSINTQRKVSKDIITHALHKVIKKVGDDTEARKYNTAIASMMEFSNLVQDNNGEISVADVEKLICIMAPYAPFVSEELFQTIHKRKNVSITKDQSVHFQKWPQYQTSHLVQVTVTMVVQVNGKLRATYSVPKDKSNDQKHIESLICNDKQLEKYISGNIKKKIFVPGKLINYVVSQ